MSSRGLGGGDVPAAAQDAACMEHGMEGIHVLRPVSLNQEEGYIQLRRLGAHPLVV